MYRRVFLSILAFVLGLGSLADAATIVWVSDNKTPANGVRRTHFVWVAER